MIGTLDEPLRDVSAGMWRAVRFPDESRWPPAYRQQERRKLLATTGGQRWLIKFAGLGSSVAVERANPEPQSAAEAEELRKAEAEGRSHAKGEDPKIKRGGSTDKA